MKKNRDLYFIINTPSNHKARIDKVKIRYGTVQYKVSHFTNLAAAEATMKAVRSLQENELTVTPLREHSRDSQPLTNGTTESPPSTFRLPCLLHGDEEG